MTHCRIHLFSICPFLKKKSHFHIDSVGNKVNLCSPCVTEGMIMHFRDEAFKFLFLFVIHLQLALRAKHIVVFSSRSTSTLISCLIHLPCATKCQFNMLGSEQIFERHLRLHVNNSVAYWSLAILAILDLEVQSSTCWQSCRQSSGFAKEIV
jgi:hypothetical protein